MVTRKRMVDFQALNDGGRPVEKLQKIDPPERVKGYIPYKEKALHKKASLCMNDIHIKHEDKYDNHVFEFSTALYELYKRVTIDYYNNLNKKLLSIVT